MGSASPRRGRLPWRSASPPGGHPPGTIRGWRSSGPAESSATRMSHRPEYREGSRDCPRPPDVRMARPKLPLVDGAYAPITGARQRWPVDRRRIAAHNVDGARHTGSSSCNVGSGGCNVESGACNVGGCALDITESACAPAVANVPSALVAATPPLRRAQSSMRDAPHHCTLARRQCTLRRRRLLVSRRCRRTGHRRLLISRW